MDTIRRDVQSLALLYTWAQQNGINLEARFQVLAFLALAEVDSLAAAARQPVSEIESPRTIAQSPQRSRTPSAARVLRLPRDTGHVQSATPAGRIRTARDHLDWLAAGHIGRYSHRDPLYRPAEDAREHLRSWLNARVPKGKGRNLIGGRDGLSAELTDAIIQALVPVSRENPWSSEFVQRRNQAMFHLQMSVGIRPGELMKLKMKDLDARQQKLTVTRSPDDLEEAREQPPQAKTRDRCGDAQPDPGSDHALHRRDARPGTGGFGWRPQGV